MKKNEKKIVLITGCSRGLGSAMVESFVSRGATVAGCARNAADIAAQSEKYGEPHLFCAVDVTDDKEVSAFCEQVVNNLGAPDLVLNNAALINTPAPLWKVPEDEFSTVIDVNIKGVANVIRHIVPAMIERGRGVIVNFSSGWGRSTSPDMAPYCATKYAIEGLNSALAQDLPAGLAAVSLNPGIINTDMLRGAWGSGAQGYEDPAGWATRAVPFLETLGPQDNGQALTAP